MLHVPLRELRMHTASHRNRPAPSSQIYISKHRNSAATGMPEGAECHAHMRAPLRPRMCGVEACHAMTRHDAQLDSTDACTRRMYSRLFSEYSRAASPLAGLFGFGSHSSDWMDVRMAATS